MIKNKDYKFKRAASVDFYRRATEPITEKNEEQTKKIEEQTGKQLPLMPLLGAPPVPPLEPLEEFRDPEPAARPKEKLIVDVDAGIDKNAIASINEDLDLDFELKMPSELLAEPGNLAEIANDKNLEQHQRNLRSEITRQEKKEEDVVLQTKHKNLKNYRDTLKKKSLAGQYMITKGKCLSRHPYKMEKDGKYGNLQIDVLQLVENKRLVTGGDSIIMDEPIDSDLIDLLTKRMEIKRKYSYLSQDIFKKLTDLSGLQPRERSKKYNIIKGGCIPTFYNSPDDLINFHELIIGSIEAGNNNNNMKNKGVAIIDELLKLGAITKDEHEILYYQNFI